MGIVDDDWEPLDPVPEMIEGHSFVVQNIHCPLWQICNWHESYVDGDNRESHLAQIRANFEEHWREYHQ